MKKQILLLLTLIAFASPAFAIAYVQGNNDGSITFMCNPASSIKVRVKKIAMGKYRVIARGGSTGFSGEVTANSEAHAARYGCAELAVPQKAQQ